MAATTFYRPRSVTEIVDAAIQLVRRNYLPLITVVALAYVPYLLLQLTVFRGIMKSALTGTLQLSPGQLGVYYVLSLIWFALVDAAVIVAASDAYLGRPVNVQAAFWRAIPRVGATAAGIVLKYLIVSAGLVLFVVPGVVLIALFFAVPSTVVLERRGPISGLVRSARLAGGLKAHVLLALLLVYGLYFGLIGGASIAFAVLGSQTAIQIFSAFATILVYPFVPTVQMLLYYDTRIRKEGYDIELQAESVAGSPPFQPA